jgi:hypothetical protein
MQEAAPAPIFKLRIWTPRTERRIVPICNAYLEASGKKTMH